MPVIEAESEFEPVILPVLIELVMLILPDPVEEAESVPVDDAVLEPVEEAELLPLIEEEAEAVSLPLVGVEEPWGFERLVGGDHFVFRDPEEQ